MISCAELLEVGLDDCEPHFLPIKTWTAQSLNLKVPVPNVLKFFYTSCLGTIYLLRACKHIFTGHRCKWIRCRTVRSGLEMVCTPPTAQVSPNFTASSSSISLACVGHVEVAICRTGGMVGWCLDEKLGNLRLGV